MSQDQNEAEKLVGTVLANTYRLEQLLASGGMGAIYRARHLRTGGTFAVKILHSRSAQNAELYERFQDEARIISSLSHPNIVTVMDLDIDQSGLAFIVMELLEGEDLQDRLERLGKVPLDEAIEICLQVSRALHAAHQKGVIHRDLKPRNIFLARQETSGHVTETAKVIDFGVSKIPRPADRATRDLLVLGTPRYMAPEGALGQNSQIDGRSDQWSVAVILYRLLSGKLPFDQENVIDLFKQVVNDDPQPIEQLVPDVPKHVVAAMRRALSKKKEERFPTMVEFMEALDPPSSKKKRRDKERAKKPTPTGPLRPVQLDIRRSLIFAGIGAALTGLLLLPIVKRASSLRKRGMQASELLQQADQALLEERWSDAGELADRVSAMNGQPDSIRSSAQITKKRAENGVQAQQVYQRLQAAVQAQDFDTAVTINRELPPSIGFRITAQQHFDLLQTLVVGLHIQKAEAARTSGQCSDVQMHTQKILQLVPDNEAALQARWRPCVSFAGETPPGPKKLAGYPPIRIDAAGTGPELPGDYPGGPTSFADIDRFLREAQVAHQAGRLWSAVTLAHVAAGNTVRAPTAWRIVAVSACGLKNTKLLAIAMEHLDNGSKEYVKAGCATLGYQIVIRNEPPRPAPAPPPPPRKRGR